jgi:hypothetical protein
MANSVSGNTIYCDTAGILYKGKLIIDGILYVPHAITDVIDLNFWDEATITSDTGFSASIASGVVTETNVDTHTLSAANFPATSVVKFLSDAQCLTANKTYHLIGTVGDNHAFTVDPVTTLTDETAKKYHAQVFPAKAFFNATCTGITGDFSSQYYPLGGVRVDNLICEAITSGAYAIIYFR